VLELPFDAELFAAAFAAAVEWLLELADRSRERRSIDCRGEGDFGFFSFGTAVELAKGFDEELADAVVDAAAEPLRLAAFAPPLLADFFFDQIVPIIKNWTSIRHLWSQEKPQSDTIERGLMFRIRIDY
jgi:hypothetical protein